MQPKETQPNIPPQMTPDEAAASLAFATQLSEGLLPKGQGDMPVEGDNMGETAPSEELSLEPEEDTNPRIDELETQFKDFQKEVKDTIKNEIGGLKEMIKESLNEEE